MSSLPRTLVLSPTWRSCAKRLLILNSRSLRRCIPPLHGSRKIWGRSLEAMTILTKSAVFLCSDLDAHETGKHLGIPSEEWKISQIVNLLRPYCPGPTFIEAWRIEKGWEIERIQDILAQ